MAWIYRSLAADAAGYDAVLQFTEEFVGATLLKRPNPIASLSFESTNVGVVAGPPFVEYSKSFRLLGGEHVTTRVTLSATQPFAPKLVASSPPAVTLSCPARLSWSTSKTTQAWEVVASWGARPGDPPVHPRTGLVLHDIVRSLGHDETPISAAAADCVVQLACPVIVVARSDFQFDILADIGAGQASVMGVTGEGAAAFQQILPILKERLSTYVEGGGIPERGCMRLIPRISLLGSGVMAPPQNLLKSVNVQVVTPDSAAPQYSPTLCLTADLVDNPISQHTTVSHLSTTGSYTTLISSRVLRSLIRARWELGTYPRTRAGAPVEDYYTEGGVRKPVVIRTEIQQFDIQDETGRDIARFDSAGTLGALNIPEDYLLLGGHTNTVIKDVVGKSDMQPVPDAVRDTFILPPDVNGRLEFHPFRLSSVQTPVPATDPALEQFLQAMRTGVTRHLSIPFQEDVPAVYRLRQVDGANGLMLSEATVST